MMLAKSLQSAAGNAAGEATYIEDVFSTYLYTGNGSTQTITNGIDLAGEGGMVWAKSRSVAQYSGMWDTVRGAGTGSGSPNNKTISPIGNLSAFYSTDYLSAFNADGFNVTYGSATYSVANESGTTYAGWAFRKQPKFFDIQTWTGNNTAGKTISHNLGSVPGCIMVLCTTANYSWFVYHRSADAGGNTTSLVLGSTSAAVNEGNAGIQNLTSTTFDLGGAGATSTRLNDSGQTYIAYIFAHNAGGFGDDGEQNVVSCGVTALNASGFATVSLGYEPQFVMIKSTQYDGDWAIYDTMRGAVALKSSNLYSAFGAQKLIANSSAAESTATDYTIAPSSTGFTLSATGYAGADYDDFIYIAIRRPMKTPESGTEVFAPVAQTGEAEFNNSFPVDLVLERDRTSPAFGYTADRLRGGAWALDTTSTTVEFDAGPAYFDSPNGKFRATFVGGPSQSVVYWNFRRAPGFFDEVCYTGTGQSSLTLNHNLGVVPELVIHKSRTSGTQGNWMVVPQASNTRMFLNSNSASPQGYDFLSGTRASWTATTLPMSGFSAAFNSGSDTYIVYLFASCPGVSKVGSYTGTGTTQQINCGFTSGARFVLIKRTDSTGDWYVWDSARGIVSGNDPYLLLNSTAAENTSTDYIDPYSAGFEISSTAPAAINASGGSFVYLAIA